VTAYNGAAPLITSKTLLAPAVGIGLVEGYHAGIVSIAPPAPVHNVSACCTLAIITVISAVYV